MLLQVLPAPSQSGDTENTSATLHKCQHPPTASAKLGTGERQTHQMVQNWLRLDHPKPFHKGTVIIPHSNSWGTDITKGAGNDHKLGIPTCGSLEHNHRLWAPLTNQKLRQSFDIYKNTLCLSGSCPFPHGLDGTAVPNLMCRGIMHAQSSTLHPGRHSPSNLCLEVGKALLTKSILITGNIPAIPRVLLQFHPVGQDTHKGGSYCSSRRRLNFCLARSMSPSTSSLERLKFSMLKA